MASQSTHHAHPPPQARDGVVVVRVERLSAGYGRSEALSEVSFTLAGGNLVGLIGPNGSGKTTLLKTLVGLLRPWSGRVEVLGRAPARARERLGYMPQAETVDWNFPITVREVVAMGRYRRRWGHRLPDLLRARRDRSGVVDVALEQVRAADLAGSQIGELSGGQQRRVLLARALVREPDLLLLDEPAAGLDAAAEEDLMALLLGLAETGKTLIVATHDIGSVFEHYPLTLCLNRRLLAAGPPRDVLTEETLIETFGRHLMVFHRGEHGYTVEPHAWHGVHEHD